jgi:non-ribosomal peptide synthetase-like protein
MSQSLAAIANTQLAVSYDEPKLLHEFFERQVALRPDHPAIECNGETLTYAQLDELANRIAAILHSRGLRPGSLVAVYLEKSHRLFAALLGVLKVGAAYVPIDPKFPIGRIQSIVEDAQITTIISEGDIGQGLQPHVAASVMLLEAELAEDVLPASPPLEPVVVTPSDACYVIYTSGSTGRPKGVVIEHRNAANFVRSLHTVYKLGPQDRVYQGFSVAFDASVEEVWGAFSLGGTLVVPTDDISRSTFDAADFINSKRITFFSTVPSFLAMINADLPTVRLLVVGGEACVPELVSRWAKPGRRMLNTYGPTETTVVATATDCTPGQPVTIGVALPHYVTWVLDEEMRAVQPGDSGELYVGGEGVARGYLNRPELTAERFVQMSAGEEGGPSGRLYRTFDLVRLAENGALQFLGRADAQIKIRGFRVELSEIEAVLMEHPAIQAAAVNLVEFGNLKELAAYVVLEADVAELDRESIAELLRRRMPEYMVPRYLEVMDKLPVMTSGKVDRKLLPPASALLVGANRSVVAPATELERTVAEVWEKVFQVSPISVEDDFFLNLRGHSLTAAHVVSEMRSRLNTLQVSVRDLYAHRTIRALASHLETMGVKVAAAGDQAGRVASSGEDAKASLPWTRWPCAALQLVGVLGFYAVVASPVVFLVVLILKVLNDDIALERAAQIATVVGFLLWPSWLLMSIALKWIVIGRYKPGRHKVWGFYYFRWWLVTRFQALSWSEMFVGTPLMSLYYRAMGAKVGKHCTIGTPICAAFDLVTIGTNSSVGSDTQMLGYRVENGWLIFDTVTIGDECFVGNHCCLGLNATMQDRARLGDMSLLPDNAVIASDQDMCGSPAVPADIDLPELQGQRWTFGRTFLFGLIHLCLIYVMGYILIVSVLPAMAMVGYALYIGGPAWGVGAAFASVPVSLVWYLLLVVGVKRIAIGRILPGVYSVLSMAYVRYWFLNYLLNNTRHIVLPLYATMFLPSLLRMLGAKIGSHVEISTAMHIMPDLLEIEEGSFLADACIVGGHRIHRGFVDICSNKIGKRTFIGNSALVPSGVDVGDDSLIGVMSTPPAGVLCAPNGTRWLGSPSFELPVTEHVTGFTDAQTFHPSNAVVWQRAAIELMRVILPGLIAVASLVLLCTAVVMAYAAFPLWAVVLLAPVAMFGLSLVSILVVAGLKKLLIGTFAPTIQPLWSSYVWLNEVVNALYETIVAAAVTPLMGTPFISWGLRAMGCKIGRWVFLETTLFSEFDLVEIGDYASLNLGSTIQTHLFEDRVMKADHLKIGEGCSVGNMTVVLYGTEMQHRSSLAPLSVLMKGEVLPAYSRWSGIPTKPVDSMPPVEEIAQSVMRGLERALGVPSDPIGGERLGAPTPHAVPVRGRFERGGVGPSGRVSLH